MRLDGKKILSIDRDASDLTIIDWVLGNYCNFKCSYCFPNANTGTDRVPRLDDVLKRNVYHLMEEIDAVSKQKIVFNFGGGEPTGASSPIAVDYSTDASYTLIILSSGYSLVKPPSVPGAISFLILIFAKVPLIITSWLPRLVP